MHMQMQAIMLPYFQILQSTQCCMREIENICQPINLSEFPINSAKQHLTEVLTLRLMFITVDTLCTLKLLFSPVIPRSTVYIWWLGILQILLIHVLICTLFRNKWKIERSWGISDFLCKFTNSMNIFHCIYLNGVARLCKTWVLVF